MAHTILLFMLAIFAFITVQYVTFMKSPRFRTGTLPNPGNGHHPQTYTSSCTSPCQNNSTFSTQKIGEYPEQRTYSTVNYIDGLIDHREKLAQFKNVCYRAKDKTYYFFAPPHHEYLGPRNMHNFSETEFQLTDYARGKKWLKLNVAKGPIINPTLQRTPENMYWLPEEVVVLLDMDLPVNLGHFVANDAFASFMMPHLFKLEHHMPHNLRLFAPDRNCVSTFKVDYSEPFEPLTATCERFSKAFLSAVSSLPVLTVSDTKMETIFQDHEFVCFKNLLTGQMLLSFLLPLRNFGWGRYYWEYRDAVLRHHGIDPDYRPTKHRIVFLHKKGRRILLNQDQTIEHLKKMFPNVQFDVVEFAKISVLEQLKLTMNGTLFMTPAGGTSFSGLFIPVGSSLLIFDTFLPFGRFQEPKGQTFSNGIEEFWWRHLPWMNAFDYRVAEGEQIISGTPYPRFKDYFLYADTNVNLSRMTKMVFYALYETEKRFGWIDFCEWRVTNPKMERNDVCFEKKLALRYIEKNPDPISKDVLETQKIWKHWNEKFKLRDYA